ncbi:PREDICTED: agamous-like MADS-box protein AGL86 [Ipomoea nil]|uniref:agamous-like MADS-box protein AGL86 n=1 Tax=Ipomoea nil TaxID=35883 RepID=UPI000900F4C8|nr:PREDICTED: agamous-like MADS-box protein AGL86 [Ipomoea nil]
MRAAVKKHMIERRTGALFKKAKELSVLCGSEIGIVIVSPTMERSEIIWPAVEAATKMFLAFMEVPEDERVKRMVFHEEYMRGKVNEAIRKMRRVEEEVERKEMNVLMTEVIAGRKSLTEMDTRQLKGLYALADDKMAELAKREQDLLGVAQNNGAAAAARSPHRCLRNRRDRNLHRPAATDAAVSDGLDGGGSYYVPQPPAPPFDPRWTTTPPAPAGQLLPNIDPATWFIPNMVAPPPPPLQGGGFGGEGSYQPQMFFPAGGGALPTNNGGGGEGSYQVPAGLNQDWLYTFFPSSI